jgi:hypothetical protein
MSEPKLYQGNVDAVAGRRERFTWTIRTVDDDGDRVGLNVGDVVRFKLCGTEGGTPVLDIASDTPGAGGSLINITSLGSPTTDAEGIVELRRGDTEDFEGKLYFEMDLDDSGDGDRTSQPLRGTITFKPSMGGTIGA